jgi:predicted glycogen debranching enzyme
MQRTLRPIHVSREVCTNLERGSKLEWLETDGLGGFAMGTAIGLSTRRYHGLLVAALQPPVDRFVLLSKVEETVCIGGQDVELGTTQYPGVVAPRGYERLESFRLDPFPIWTYLVEGARIEKRLFLVHGRRAVVIQYRAERACRLLVRPFIAFRDFHAVAHANDAIRRTFDDGPGVMRLRPYEGMPELALHHSGAASRDGADWYHKVEYLEELARGLDFQEDLFCAGTLTFDLRPGEPAWIVATIDDGAYDADAVATLEEAERARRTTTEQDPQIARLAAAADQFRVKRADGRPTVIAGYPWFADWGRDTMIALPGLLIARGLLFEAREVLRGFLEHLDRGLVPNRFPDRGERPEYNTVDGTLWMFHAIAELARAGGDSAFVRDVFWPRAKEILAWHAKGTHHGIRVDPEDGLLISGDPGTQLTWMDAKVGDWVVTPRHGKAVEINALYYNALEVSAQLARDYGDPLAASLAESAERVRASFLRTFWDERRGYLLDVVLPDGPDTRVRPNQIFAVSLPHSMLSMDQMRAVVSTVERELLTPFGLRTLARDAAGFRATYGGDAMQRDGAYHQGTVWPWLIGPFVTAYLKAFGRTRANLAGCTGLVEGLLRHLGDGCLGSISEVFDAEVPHAPGGAPAQAWSVSELLRVLSVDLRPGRESSPARAAVSSERDLHGDG